MVGGPLPLFGAGGDLDRVLASVEKWVGFIAGEDPGRGTLCCIALNRGTIALQYISLRCVTFCIWSGITLPAVFHLLSGRFLLN